MQSGPANLLVAAVLAAAVFAPLSAWFAMRRARSPVTWLLLGALPIYSLAGLSGGPFQSIATREVQPNEQGQLRGALTALRSMVTLVTPGLYTGTFALFVGPLAGLGLPGAPYLLAAILMATTAVLVMRSATTLRSPAAARSSG